MAVPGRQEHLQVGLRPAERILSPTSLFPDLGKRGDICSLSARGDPVTCGRDTGDMQIGNIYVVDPDLAFCETDTNLLGTSTINMFLIPKARLQAP